MLRLFMVCLFAVGALGELQPRAASAQPGTTATGTSNELNPAIGLNSLFLAGLTDPESDEDGIKIQAVELSLSSVVDPYFKAWATVGFEPESGGGEAHLAVEEAWVTALGLPEGFAAKAGRFLLPLGRHNQLHLHQYPFVMPPRAWHTLLGEESAGDVGVMPSYSPYLPWYMNVSVYVTDGANELFDGEARAMAAGARVDNLWDVSESATLEVGASVLNGPAPAHEGLQETAAVDEDDRRTLYGADVRVKWKDARKTHGRALEWVAEVLIDHLPGRDDVRGMYTTFQYRFARQWWAGAGFSWDSLVPEGGERGSESEVRGQLAWVPSEFSMVRANVSWLDPREGDSELAVRLQLNFTIGAHPAHKY